jgi:ribosome modulation factor
MTFTSPLSDSEQKLVDYLRTNQKRPEFAVARRQQWHLVLPMLDKAIGQAKAYQYLATGFQLAAGGFLSEEQITGSAMLTEAQRKDLLTVRATYQRGQHVRELLEQAYLLGFQASGEGYNAELMPGEEPLTREAWVAGRDIELIMLLGTI